MSQRIDELIRGEDPTKTYASFEFLPPRSAENEREFFGVRVPALVSQSPVFMDMTWGAGGSTSDTTMEVCQKLKEAYPSIPINMHLTCTNMKKEIVFKALDFAKEHGIRNILALRGDPPKGQKFEAEEGLTCALDLVKLIREKYGDYFCLTVAGYPEGHPSKINENNVISEEDYEEELKYLKEKVDAGANLIITQLFYDAKQFIRFVKRSRAIGIMVPILPGLMPFYTYKGVQRMVKLCKTYLSEEVKAQIEALKEDNEGFIQYGATLTASIINEIAAADIGINHYHFFTINSTQPTLAVLKEIGLLREE